MIMKDKEKIALAYNLDEASEKEALNSNRVFDVLVNGKVIIESLNLVKNYGAEKAVSIKIKQLVDTKKGIVISFKAIKGEPILNALKVKKVF